MFLSKSQGVIIYIMSSQFHKTSTFRMLHRSYVCRLSIFTSIQGVSRKNFKIILEYILLVEEKKKNVYK